MLHKTYCIKVLLENSSGWQEKQKIQALTEAEQAVVNDRMVGSLYQSILKKKNIDFDDIPFSKGDIQKVDGYENMVATIETVKQLGRKFNIKLDEVEIVENAIVNIRTYKGTFERGFGLDNEFMKLYYNTLVYACIESTSLIVSSYIEYVKTINNVEFRIKKGKGIYGNICLESLNKFNESVKDGSFVKFANSVMDKGNENFMGRSYVGYEGTPLFKKILAVVTVVPMVRELIYYFYESRMNVSEYLQQQKDFLEMNKFRLESSSMDAQKRNKILAKQQKAIERLDRMSDKIRVNHQLANKNAEKEIQKDNKDYSLNSVTGNDDGYMFL